MKYHHLLYVLLLIPFSLAGQHAIPDTIPMNEARLKGAGNYTVQTEVDSALTIVINEIIARNSGGHRDEAGDDDDWFEIYNFGDQPVRLNNLWFTDDPDEPYKWKLVADSDTLIHPKEYLVLWADEEPNEGILHTNFKLSGDGEYLGIHSEDNLLVDECDFGPQIPNVSYGRYPDGNMNWFFFQLSTPGKENSDPGGTMLLPEPRSSLKGGLYSNPVLLALSTDDDRCEIRYTLDCTDPDTSSMLYSAPLLIDSTTILKARLIKKGALDGPVLVRSFLFELDSFANPVVSIV